LVCVFAAPLGDGEDTGLRLLGKSRTVLTVVSFESFGFGRTNVKAESETKRVRMKSDRDDEI
jgi:hypothetical protein